MELGGFGSCGNRRECEALCHKRISVTAIARMTRDYRVAPVGAQWTFGKVSG